MENHLLLERAKSSAKPAFDAARERAFVASRAVEHFIKAKPATALGLALGMGAILGWLIKRR